MGPGVRTTPTQNPSLLVACILLLICGVAKAAYTYTTNNDNTVIITAAGFQSGDVIVPDTLPVNGVNLPVTAIGYEAYGHETSLKTVTFGPNLRSIGTWAFDSCSSMTSVVFGTNITDLGGAAFYGCTRLTSVTIPHSVTGIGSSTFSGCSRLTTVTILDGPTTIGANAFEACSQLTSIALPNTLTTIGSQVFLSCSALPHITIPASVTSIGPAFGYTSSLAAIDVDPANSTYSSSDGVLFDKAQGTLLIYPNAKSGSSYTVPNTVTNIADAAFYGSPNLQKVVLGPRMTTLQGAAFESCPHLAGVYCLGNAPALGGNYIFYGNTNVVFRLAGTAGWGVTLQNAPVIVWSLPNPLTLTYTSTFGPNSNSITFTIPYASNDQVVVDACTDLFNPAWQSIQTNPLIWGPTLFTDSLSTNYSHRFYRLRALQ
jgi:hypothetical protein